MREGPGSARRAAAASGLWLILLLPLAGCPPQREHVAPRDEWEALARVNDNLGQIDRPLQCKALVSFRFRDADGRDRRFLGHEAALVFAPERYLRFDIRSLTGVVAQFGSDGERYWLWIEPETHKLWWGHWDRLDAGPRKHMVIPPSDLLDALMLRPLPMALAGGLRPMLRRVGDDCRLLFVRLDAEGQPAGVREVRLDPYEPYQPLEIVDRLSDGRVQMHAELGNYRRVGRDGPYTPRRYVVRWPLDEAEVRLDILRARFRPDLPLDIFAFPAEWEGAVEPLDAPAEPEVPTSAPGEDMGSLR